jgi:hypothetical protein
MSEKEKPDLGKPDEKPVKPGKPTEADKLTKETVTDETVKIYIKGKEVSALMRVETKPNVKGGYDTVIKMPVFSVGQNLKG